MANDIDRIVIVGGGLAAAKAAEAVRGEGFDGSLHLLAEEPHRPYERPPLSKGVLLGTATLDETEVHEELMKFEKGPLPRKVYKVELEMGGSLDGPNRTFRVSHDFSKSSVAGGCKMG